MLIHFLHLDEIRDGLVERRLLWVVERLERERGCDALPVGDDDVTRGAIKLGRVRIRGQVVLCPGLVQHAVDLGPDLSHGAASASRRPVCESSKRTFCRVSAIVTSPRNVAAFFAASRSPPSIFLAPDLTTLCVMEGCSSDSGSSPACVLSLTSWSLASSSIPVLASSFLVSVAVGGRGGAGRGSYSSSARRAMCRTSWVLVGTWEKRELKNETG